MSKEKVNYIRGDKALLHDFERAGMLVQKFNQADYSDDLLKRDILIELLGSSGEGIFIEHNFHCDLGYNIHVGRNFYAGYNCTILDMAEVRIGDNCLIAPNVGIYTAGHNINPADRHKSGYAYPITIGNNVWIGGHSVILAGVTIGDNSIVAAASMVNKDIPANCIFGGNPARKIKDIDNY
ncbi:sugar O-acetyltransferase [Flavobacterium daejeonense]|uniref:sugar O-acetyltransferase n=1 Tax=Flavobacterium daejeonense TaxID=350893 RepID=UPI00047D0631|nr:sugar O-acetyltransferase [Flavobacterium daejeonense]